MAGNKLPNLGTTIFSTMTALANEVGAVNLSQGFPDFPANTALAELLAAASLAGHNQYAPMIGLESLRVSVAAKYKLVMNVSVDPLTEITITPGGTAALATVISAVVGSGDEVVVFEPAYDSYAPVVRLNGGIVRTSVLRAPAYTPDWDHVRTLINDRTVMIIINSPHNPCGSLLSKADIDELANICRGTPIVVLSDEVYELITFDGLRPQSVLQHEELRQRSIAVMSFGKMFHITGWKVGAFVSTPELTSRLRAVHQYINFSVNTPAQVALAEFMSDNRNYIGLGTFFEERRDFFRQLLLGSRWSIRPCSGTYFQLLGYESISEMADTEMAVRVAREFGVAAIPLSPFYSSDAGSGGTIDRVLRFCFAKSDDTLILSAKRLKLV